MAVGEDALWMSAEAASRAHLGLPGNQQQLLEAVAATGKPVVLIVFSGRPLSLNWAAVHVPAILQAWFPGVQAGPALVRTLFGDVSPSGKLTVSMPRDVGQEPLYYDELNTGRPSDGIDLTRPPHDTHEKYHSRYVDEPNAPLFPFGYGLSYTSFAYSGLKVSPESSKAGVPVNVSVTVTNSGSVKGDEVVELYLNPPTGAEGPSRALKGFKRISLDPGASTQVQFSLTPRNLSSVRSDGSRAVLPGNYALSGGGSQPGGPGVLEAHFHVNGTEGLPR